MFARLEHNTVVEILYYGDISGRFTPQIVDQCVPCDASVTVGMVWDGMTFAYPPGPTIDELRSTKQVEITNGANSLLQSLGAEYGAMEIATWDQQYSEAQAYQADAQAVVPLLTAIATVRGMDVGTLAGRIIANWAEWVAVSGAVVGQRLAYQDQLDAATTASEIEAIEVSYA